MRSDKLFTGSGEDFAILGSLVYLALSTLVSMGVTAFALAAHDNPDTVELSALWHPRPFWKYLGLSIIFYPRYSWPAIVLGFVLVTALGLETGLAIGIPLLLVVAV